MPPHSSGAYPRGGRAFGAYAHPLSLMTNEKICRNKTTYYASPTSVDAYNDRQLSNNNWALSWNFCVLTCFHMRIPKPCLSVCPHPEKRNHPRFVNIITTLVIDTSMERSSWVLHHGNPKIWIFLKKVRNWILTSLSTCAEELKSP